MYLSKAPSLYTRNSYMESHQAGYMMNPAYTYDEIGYAQSRPPSQYSYPASHNSNIYYNIQDDRNPQLTFKSSNQRKRTIALICVLLLVLVIIAVGVALGVILSKDKDDDKPSVPKVQTNFQGEGILLGKTWSDDYLDENSQLYTTAEQEFKDKVKNQLSQSSLGQYYQDVTVLGFREGSIIVEFNLGFLVPVDEVTLVNTNSILNVMILIPDVTSVSVSAISASTSSTSTTTRPSTRTTLTTTTKVSTITTTTASTTTTVTLASTNASTTKAPTTTTNSLTTTTITKAASTSIPTPSPTTKSTAKSPTTPSTTKTPTTPSTTKIPTTRPTTKTLTASTPTPSPTTQSTTKTPTTPSTTKTSTISTPTPSPTTQSTTKTPTTPSTTKTPRTSSTTTTTTTTKTLQTTTTTPTTTTTIIPTTTTTTQPPTTTPSVIPVCSEGFLLYTILIEYLRTYDPVLLDIHSQPSKDLKQFLENWGANLIYTFGAQDSIPEFKISDFGPPITNSSYSLVTIRVCIASSANVEDITSLLGFYVGLLPEYNNVGLSDVYGVIFEYQYPYESIMSNVTSSTFSSVANTLQSKANGILATYNLQSSIPAFYLKRLEPIASNSNTRAIMRMAVVGQSIDLALLDYYLGLSSDSEISFISIEQS